MNRAERGLRGPLGPLDPAENAGKPKHKQWLCRIYRPACRWLRTASADESDSGA